MSETLKYLFKYWPSVVFGFCIKVLGTVVELFLPWIMAKILDEVVPEAKITGDMHPFIFWGVLMVLCAALACVFNIYANRKASYSSKEAIGHLRYDLFDKMLTLSGKDTDKFGIPSLISRLTSDSYNVHQFYNIMQRMGVRAPLIVIGGLIVSSTLDPIMTLTLVAILPFVFFVVFTVSRKGVPLYEKVQLSVDKMVKVMREDISGIRVIKALSKENHERKRFEEANSETVTNELKASGVMALSGPFVSLFLNLGLVLVVIVGAYRVNSGASQPGTIVAFLTYFTMILNALIAVNRIFISYSKGAASSKRIMKVMHAQNILQVEEYLAETKPQKRKGYEENTSLDGNPVIPKIQFKNVWFAYNEGKNDEEEKYVLKNINFVLNPGETLGVIGATGSGKTTIINILMRFYDVTRGEILIDGRNIKTFDLAELRKRFGTVFQNDYVFANTLAENIKFGRDISDEDMEAATKLADAYNVITAKSGGFQHEAAIRGADLSGGQKQRLFLSRAFAGKPEILVLDDSSSALDYKTDAFIRQGIRNEFSDSTKIVIAQRISSIMHSDRILVLEDGEIMAQGTHEELFESCEVYKEIAESQLGSLMD